MFQLEPLHPWPRELRPVRSLAIKIGLILFVFLSVGFAAWRVGREVWASHEFRSAERALEQGDFGAARAHLAHCLRQWPEDRETRFMAAQAARRDGDLADADRLLGEYKRLGGSPEALREEYRLRRFQEGDLSEVEAYLAFCATSPDSPQTPLVLEAVVQGGLKAGELARALVAVQLWLKHPLAPAERARVLVWRGDILLRATTYEKALIEYRQAVELDPENDTARLRLTNILLRTSPHEALGHLESLLQRRPGDRRVRLQMARCRRSLGEVEEAARLLDQLLAENPDDNAALLERGKVALDLGQKSQAEEFLRHARRLAPEDREPNLFLAQCLRQQGKDEEAQPYEERYKEIDARIEAQIEAQVKKMKDELVPPKTPASP
jgi:Flp pilus assembly protein TadD